MASKEEMPEPRRWKFHRLAGHMVWCLAGILLTLAWCWSLLVLWFFPQWHSGAQITTSLLWVFLSLIGLLRVNRKTYSCAILLGVTVTTIVWSSVFPSNYRQWTDDQVRMPLANFEGNLVTVENVRHATYRTVDDCDVQWETRQFDLNVLESMDFVVERFGLRRGPVHTFLTFGFADGEYIEKGESFSPLHGLFKHYELMYVVGDERDLIDLRANIRKNSVWVFPIRAKKQKVRQIFLAMLERANRLRQDPEFYHTLTSTCFSNIVRHVNELNIHPIPYTYHVLLPGYSDDLVYNRGGMDFEGTFDDARARFRINGRSEFTDDGRVWSG